MITDLISENKLKELLACWTLENDIKAYLAPNSTKEEYIEYFRIPELDYKHTQSLPDNNGNLQTLLKAEISLSDWETKNGREKRTFVIYQVLSTPLSAPETEPFPIGYIAVY